MRRYSVSIPPAAGRKIRIAADDEAMVCFIRAAQQPTKEGKMIKKSIKTSRLFWIVLLTALLLFSPALWAGHKDDDGYKGQESKNALPSFIVRGSVEVTEYDGQTLRDGYPDDLLSGGLNADGLQSGTPPGFEDPLNPTATELRRLAIYGNYRALTDMTTEGGYGLFWGPALAPTFPGVEQGLIPGIEYTALMKKPAGSGNVNNVPVAVQIPDHFDPDDPCVFLAPPSGSRGYYGGIAIGEWGLFEGCAVVLPGKASGTGFHLLGTDEVYDRDGMLTPAGEAGRRSQFTVKKTGKLSNFLDEHPDAVATKHAHSQINPERLWGDLALQGIEFAFWALNREFSNDRQAKGDDGDDDGKKPFRPENTYVIASGTSNGAGTTLRALEKDKKRIIDAAVVLEPNINPDSAGKFVIDFGDDLFAGHGTSLYDSISLMGVYAPCAALSPSLTGTPFNLDPIGAPVGARANRCQSLREFGLLSEDSLDAQADEALGILREKGYYEEEDTLLASHEWLNLWRSLNPTYAAAHGRFAVWDNLCGINFGATDGGMPTSVPSDAAVRLFSTSNGIPPTGGIDLINDVAVNGPILENLSESPTSGLQDLNLDGARCFRYLATGDPSLLDEPPNRRDRRRFRRVQRGIQETLTTGDLRGTPTMIITGRSDALVFPNYHSRPYFGLNQLVEGSKSRLSYIEVLNAQHFEVFISTLWIDSVTGVQFVPLHYYLFDALDQMYAYLKGEVDDRPPSQVVRPEPRGFKPYEDSDRGTNLLPPIELDPDDGDRIIFDDKVLHIPK
jgi:hydroxybutyrate-dimer hydrolase